MSSSKVATGKSSLFPSSPKVATQKPRIPRVAALIAGLTRPNKRLITAVDKDDLSQVCEILNDQSNVVWFDSVSLRKAMYYAVDQGHEEAVRLLLEQGADANADGVAGTVLQRASEDRHEQIVRLLLENGANANVVRGGTALLRASAKGHAQVVRLLLEKGANVNDDGALGDSALQKASAEGHEQVVRLLLEKGADVHANGMGWGTALQRASEGGYERVVRLLLEKGADVNANGERGVHAQVARLLVKTSDANGGWHGTALQRASANGHGRVVRLLLDRGADVDADGVASTLLQRDSGGQVYQVLFDTSDEEWGGTALQRASEEGRAQVVQLLLEKGADVNAGGEQSSTALQRASAQGHGRVVRLLLEKGADVNAKGKRGTALQRALEQGDEQVVRLLLKKGADFNIRMVRSASSRRHPQIVQLLLEYKPHYRKELRG
jgi:ankyrin repeat protein